MKPDVPADVAIFNCERQDHKIRDVLDRKLIAQSQPALERGEPVRVSSPIRNTDRTVGAMLSGEIAKRYGHEGLPADTIRKMLMDNPRDTYPRLRDLAAEGEGTGKGEKEAP